MKMGTWLVAAGAIVATVLLSNAQAQAQSPSTVNVTLPASAAGGLTFVGVVGVDAWAGTKRLDGTCVWTRLATGTSGLSASTSLNGTTGVDTINLFSWDVSHCGFTIRPLNTNGFALKVNGGGGNDHIESYQAGQLWGQAGHDWLAGWDSYVEGNDGNDTITVDEGGIMVGGNGNDTMYVVNGEYAWSVYGGAGDDYLCGRSSNAVSAVEHHSFNCIP